jgi:hypothetical protein
MFLFNKFLFFISLKNINMILKTNFNFTESQINTIYLLKQLLSIPSLSLLFNFFLLMIIKRKVFASNKKIFNIMICFSSIIQTLSNFLYPNHSFFDINCLYTNLLFYVFQIEILVLIFFLNAYSIFLIDKKTINRFILSGLCVIFGIAYFIM